MKFAAYLAAFTHRRIAAITVLGFASGLPFSLTSSTLQAWLSDVGFDVKTIGWFTIIGQPYIWKFLWAPFLDRFFPPFLGRRRSWIVICQVLLALTIAALANINPQTHLLTFAAIALLIVFFSATQDIVVDAYRVDIATPAESGTASAVHVLGYRLAMIASGAGALFLVDQYYSWQHTYSIMALVMAGLAIATAFTPEPVTPADAPKTLEEALFLPFRDFFTRDNALVVLAAVVLYKLSDAFAFSLSIKFFLDTGFSKTTIAEITKIFGLISTIIGGLFGAAVMLKIGLFRALVFFAVLQSLSSVGFWLLAHSGKHYWLFVTVVGFEHLASGMATTANMAFLMCICNKRFSAAQYALLSALSACGRVYVGPVAGYIVAAIGWGDFFLFAASVGIPSIVAVYCCRNQIAAFKI